MTKRVLFTEEISIESDYKVIYTLREGDKLWIHYTGESDTFITLKVKRTPLNIDPPKGIRLYDTELHSVVMVKHD